MVNSLIIRVIKKNKILSTKQVILQENNFANFVFWNQLSRINHKTFVLIAKKHGARCVMVKFLIIRNG